MSRYIDADLLLEKLEKQRAGVNDQMFKIGMNTAMQIVRYTSAADVEEVRHGEWVHGREIRREYIGDALINIYYENFTCSCCRYLIDDKYYSRILYKRCPECGAHMR